MTAANNAPLTKPYLPYPFVKGWAPEPGKPFEVSAGVFWLRMPLPGSLNHINLWLLKDNEEWVIVDTGIDAESCKGVWEQVFETFCLPSQVNRIYITHFHMDHIGLASWLALKCHARIYMTRGEFARYHGIVIRDEEKNTETVRSYYHSLGFDQDTCNATVKFFKADNKPKEARVQPEQVSYIKEGDRFTTGGNQWEVIGGNGHSPEHACFYNEEDQIMISGDQSLPRISSNVSIYPGNNDKNPLGDWISSCEKLRDRIPQQVTILPAHQEPFRNNPARMQYIIDEHQIQLDVLRTALVDPQNVTSARRHLFDRKLDPVQKVLATGETMAHLRYLTESGEVKEWLDDDGIIWFQTT